MNPDLPRVAEAFEQAVILDPPDRRAFLAELERQSPELRAEVEALLVADDSAGDFLGASAIAALDVGEVLADESDHSRGRLPDEREVLDWGAPTAAEDPVGGTLGPYRILRRVGTGGMSDVYLGERQGEGFTVPVAVKLIRHGLPVGDLSRQLVRERRVLAALRHPHIARLLDGGTTPDGRPYLVMEYVDGVPIDVHCRAEGLGLRPRLELFQLVCDAVAHAHRALVVHRDLKPSNILVERGGTPKLLDFGIAKLLREAADPTDQDERSSLARIGETAAAGGGRRTGYGDGSAEATPTGFVMMSARALDDPFVTTTATQPRFLTPRYASPEQLRGEPTTTATDVYSLGVLLYELLTGSSPYGAVEGRPALEVAVLSEQPVPPSRVATQRGRRSEPAPGGRASTGGYENLGRLAGDLDTIVLMALRKEPERRYASVEQFSLDLDRYLRGLPVLARPDTLRYRASKFVRRNLAWVSAAVLLAVALIAFGTTSALQLRRTATERDRANREAETARETTAFLEGLFRANDPGEALGREVSAREILARGVRTLRTSLGDEPIVRARLLRTLGSVHLSLGFYEVADSLIVESVDLFRAHPGEERELAAALDLRGHVAKQRGELRAALGFAEEALVLREAHLGVTALQTSQSLNNLAVLERRLGNPERARELLERSLAIKEGALEPNDLEIAGTLHNLGNIEVDLGRLTEAEAYYRRALHAFEAAGERGRRGAFSATSGLAQLALKRGDYAAAESLETYSLRAKEAIFGEWHDQVAGAWANLGFVREARGDLVGAEVAADRALAIYARTVGEEHEYYAEVLLSLGKLCRERGERDAARVHFRRAHSIFVAALPAGHPSLARVDELLRLVETPEGAGRSAEATGVDTPPRP